jgi:hypothetical protein
MLDSLDQKPENAIDKEIRNDRIKLCEKCENFTTLKFCKLCNCFMPLKTWFPNKKCPDGRW